MNMNEFRATQPLTEEDFVAIRRNVMTAIAARNQRRLFPIVMRFAIAADGKVRDPVDKSFLLLGLEVVGLQNTARRGVIFGARATA